MKSRKESKNEINLNEWEIVETEKKKEEEDTQNTKKQTIFDEFLSESDWEHSESIYKNKILESKWFKKSKDYLDFNTFIKNIPSFHYFDSHSSNLEDKFKEKNFKSVFHVENFASHPNSKKLCRLGVPPNFMHQTLLKFFNITKAKEQNYNKLFSIIFKEHDVKNLGDYVPYFTGKKTFKESLPFHYLNEEGILELKIILWMVNDIYRNVVIYCPILIKIISLILIFCDKYETFEIVCRLIDEEKEKNKRPEIKRRLKFTKNDNEFIINSLESCVNELSQKKKNEYYENLKKIDFNKRLIYEDIYNDFFFHYFNFYGLIRFLPFFLRQGFRSFYKLICSIEDEIMEKNIKFENKEEVINKIRENTQKFDIDELFNNSFDYKFKINEKEKLSQDEIVNESNEFYLPNYKGGNLLTDYEIIHLWELLPNEYKIKNASIIYQAEKNGYNLPTILELEEKYNKNTFILFLIQTKAGDKFGFVCSNLLTHTNYAYQRPTTSYLFTIKPEFKLYSPNVDSDEILYITEKDFIFGNGSNGPAIQLNEDIMNGASNEGGCFGNPCLVSNPEGHFIVTKLEIFKLE